MIIQRAPDSDTAFAITMAEHTAFAGQLARAFGNEAFESVEPRELMLHVIDHHDIGWEELDGRALVDPDTGLPYHLVNTPFELIIQTSSRSPERNAAKHPYCGLLSSMHSFGLYRGRYGMSDMVLLDALAEENRAVADRMLAGEHERQEALKRELASNPETALWIETDALFQNYKQLQFFDTLALYFNCTAEGLREGATFTHVPRARSLDTDVTVTPHGDQAYAFVPFPFREDEMAVSFTGRYMTPRSETAGKVGTQTVRLLNGERL